MTEIWQSVMKGVETCETKYINIYFFLYVTTELAVVCQ